MTRVISSMVSLAVALSGIAACVAPAMAQAQQAPGSQTASPAYLRTNLIICASNTIPCQQQLFGPEMSLAQARAAWIQAAVYAGPLTPGNPNPPLDRAPHTLRLVVAKSIYRTDAPLTLGHWWTGQIRGRFSWKLSSLVTLPTRRGQQNYFRFLVSLDGWPTPAEQTVAIPL